MSTHASGKTKPMPKGGRKGGTVFPRVSLQEALLYSKKLVSKTHTGPQARDVILMGVFGSKHEKGEVGMSALRQYGLMKGDSKTGFSADQLARRIEAAPPEEAQPLYREAALKPKVFRAIFDTYHGDAVSKAKLKQRAADLKIHPDETSACVDRYVSSMLTAGLVTMAGDQVVHVASKDALSATVHSDREDFDSIQQREGQDEEEPAHLEPVVATTQEDRPKLEATPEPTRDHGSDFGPRAVFNVNVTLDASLDVDKLERQLAILKRYGALR